MRKYSLNKVKYFTRWFLLIGVMSGIFFSSGEGIRLLPFPNQPESVENNLFPEKQKSFGSYNLSVHNSGKNALEFKSKFQKELRKDLATGALSFQQLNLTKNFQLQSEKHFEKSEFSYNSVFLICPSDRGPPLV